MFYKVAITTIDNPFNPFTQFDDWFAFDTQKGYNTCSYLARIANFSESFTEHEIISEKERAIDEIIAYNPLGIYVKLKENDEKPYEIYESGKSD